MLPSCDLLCDIVSLQMAGIMEDQVLQSVPSKDETLQDSYMMNSVFFF